MIVLAGAFGGEGKPVFPKPLHNVFKDRVVNVAKEAGNFRLLDIMGCQLHSLMRTASTQMSFRELRSACGSMGVQFQWTGRKMFQE